ncbi:hypothetical protein [Ornithinimicrobium kibberense]|uniref:hypothetical protein n=1 Tax=Ornithinimicrobium kibberense TaxID=282060 RepID=UPI0036197749
MGVGPSRGPVRRGTRPQGAGGRRAPVPGRAAVRPARGRGAAAARDAGPLRPPVGDAAGRRAGGEQPVRGPARPRG